MKTLKVVKPYFVLEEGDVLNLSEDGKYFVSEYTEDFDHTDDEGTITSFYKSTYNISLDYAKRLIKDGYLVEEKPKKKFVNVFDEIDTLLSKYKDDLSKSKTHEQTTVLANMCKMLDHLKTLKK